MTIDDLQVELDETMKVVAEEIEATSKSKIFYPADEQADDATGKSYYLSTKEGNPIYFYIYIIAIVGSCLKFSQLRDKILYLNKWKMEIRS